MFLENFCCYHNYKSIEEKFKVDRANEKKVTCGMIFFSITSLKSGGGGRSNPSIKNGILEVSKITSACSSAVMALFWSSPFSFFSKKPLLGISFTTSNSPYKYISSLAQLKQRVATRNKKRKDNTMNDEKT